MVDKMVNIDQAIGVSFGKWRMITPSFVKMIF